MNVQLGTPGEGAERREAWDKGRAGGKRGMKTHDKDEGTEPLAITEPGEPEKRQRRKATQLR